MSRYSGNCDKETDENCNGPKVILYIIGGTVAAVALLMLAACCYKRSRPVINSRRRPADNNDALSILAAQQRPGIATTASERLGGIATRLGGALRRGPDEGREFVTTPGAVRVHEVAPTVSESTAAVYFGK